MKIPVNYPFLDFYWNPTTNHVWHWFVTKPRGKADYDVTISPGPKSNLGGSLRL